MLFFTQQDVASLLVDLCGQCCGDLPKTSYQDLEQCLRQWEDLGHGHRGIWPLCDQIGWVKHRALYKSSWRLGYQALQPLCKHPKECYDEKPFYGVNYPEQSIHLIDYKDLLFIDIIAFLTLMQLRLSLCR